MFTIYQIKVTEEVHNYVNSNDRGHTGAAEKYPLYEAKLQTQHHGSDGFEPHMFCLLYTSPSPRDGLLSRMPSSA